MSGLFGGVAQDGSDLVRGAFQEVNNTILGVVIVRDGSFHRSTSLLFRSSSRHGNIDELWFTLGSINQDLFTHLDDAREFSKQLGEITDLGVDADAKGGLSCLDDDLWIVPPPATKADAAGATIVDAQHHKRLT